MLAGMTCALAQPSISSVVLTGQPQTANDTFHFYAGFSASPGADVTLTALASGTAPVYYQWQFDRVDLPGETNAGLRLASLQLTNAGDYTVIVRDTTGTSSNTITLGVDPTFTKITTGPLVTDSTPLFAGIFGDYDGDGFPDLLVFFGSSAGRRSPKLYRNNGGGTFTEVVGDATASVSVNCTSACFGDYDNDGNLDLFMAAPTGNLLFHNNGDATFTRILTGPPNNDLAHVRGASWVDYNNDGFLDLFVGVEDSATNSHCFLYRNRGDGTFDSVSNNVLGTDLASSLGLAWADYDNDGWPDVFVCGGRGPGGSPEAPNRLYHNNGDGTFTRITSGNIVSDTGWSVACAWGDFSNRGLFDLFVANGVGRASYLYRNNGDGTFTRDTNDIVATTPGPAGVNYGSFTCAVGDYDNDGFLDLFVANHGDPSSSPLDVTFMYHNNGDGTFTRITTGSPANEYSDSWNCVLEDYDNDGFLDLYVTREGGQGNYLYHNNGNSNNWLIVKLIGTVSNRSAIGAKVRVKASYRGATRWQSRQITGGTGYSGHGDLRAHFGLGDATIVDTVRIEWPSGTVQELHNVAPRQILTYVEPPRLLASAINGTPQFSLKGGRFMQYDILTSTDLASWSQLGSVTITNMDGTAQIPAANGSSADCRFLRAVSH
jgi:enediyne biosynthesis protein E4